MKESDRASTTEFCAFGQRIEFSLFETAHRHPRELAVDPVHNKASLFAGNPVKYIPTGKLSLDIAAYERGFQRHWIEGKRHIQELLPDIVTTLFKLAVLRRRADLKRQAEEDARQRRELELQKLRRRVEEEERRVKQLCDAAENWKKAKTIREYVLATIDLKKERNEDLGPDTPLGIWVAWALQQADRLDPLAKSPSSILDRKKELPDSRTEPWRSR